MREEKIKASDLKALINELSEKHFITLRAISLKIGYDEKTARLQNILRGRNHKQLEEAYNLIRNYYEKQLEGTEQEIEIITFDTLKKQQDEILLGIEKIKKHLNID